MCSLLPPPDGIVDCQVSFIIVVFHFIWLPFLDADGVLTEGKKAEYVVPESNMCRPFLKLMK